VKPHWEKAIQGTIILLAVVAQGVRTKRTIQRTSLSP
jgi:ribose/xylose/arabinose/galactoside ABC-type transport system permease subunit